MRKNSESFSVGELAAQAGVSPDTIRHYESKGVIPRATRGPNGYRLYSPAAAERLALVRKALSIGFTLDEIAEILRARDRGQAPCRRVRDLAAEKLRAIEERLAELEALRDELRSTLRQWELRLRRTLPSQPAFLLESLSSRTSRRAPSLRHFTTSSNKQPRK